MWYDREYENASLHPTFDRKRTRPHPSRLTLERRLCLAPQPSVVSICSWPTSISHSRPSRLPQANGAQHHPRLQCPGTGCVARRLFASPSTAYDLSRRGVRGAAGSFASQPPRLWPGYQCVDFAKSTHWYPGQSRGGCDAKDPAAPLTPRLERSYAVDGDAKSLLATQPVPGH